MLLRVLILLCLMAAPALARPNIVLILADDFSMNLMPGPADGITGNMPHLRDMQREGMTLTNYFVVNSLCCPSRTSILTGRLPHNTGVLTNSAPDGGEFAFDANGNEARTFALPLQSQGYETGFMGKYLNGYNENDAPNPTGWDEWASTSKGYQSFGYSLNHNGVLTDPSDHFTDRISKLGRRFIADATWPFFLELAPFSTHGPFIPPARHDDLFLGAVMPKTPAFDYRPDATAPQWMRDIPALTQANKDRFERNFVLRLQAAQGIDDMIGDVRRRLDDLGLADNTYVIFTSDNGFHMGDWSAKSGKKFPFDTDIRVPFVIVGPGIEPGTNDAMAMSIDLYPTFLELAEAAQNPGVDGRSMVPLFTGGDNGRTMAVIEHTMAPFDPDDPDASEIDPPTYVALRLRDALYVEYETGEVGYYDLITDPHQLHNVAAALPAARLAELHAAALANAACAGAVQCAAAQEMP